MNQFPLTMIAPIARDSIQALKTVLSQNENDIKISLAKLGNVHYARWVIIEATGKYRAQLAFESNVDVEIDTHVNQLATEMGPILEAIYCHCDGYISGDIASFLKKIRAKEAAFYQGAPGRSVKTIANERILRTKLVEIIESRPWNNQSAKQIHTTLQKEVLSDPEFSWAKQTVDVPKINWLGLALLGVVLLLLSPLLLIWAIYLQFFHELYDSPGTITSNDVSDQLNKDCVSQEDFYFQNQFSQVMVMKPGWARLVTVKFFYFLTSKLVDLFFVNGQLMGIPTIHFARWIMIDNQERMLFFSNFDGSWRQYLGDFIDKSGWGLNAIFGNTANFPRIWFIFFKGAYDEQHFLGWSRSTQIPTQIWFFSNIDQSIENINDNTMIRNDLSRNLDEESARRFLARL